MHFIYKAADLQGHTVEGQLDAETKAELSQRLQASNLLLLSAHAEEEFKMPEDWVAPPQDAPASTDVRNPLKQWLYSIAIIGMGVAFVIWQDKVFNKPRNLAAAFNEKIAQLETGMTRQAVENIVTQHFPKQPDPPKVWYFVPPYMIIEITFDMTGGGGSSQNRVISDGIRAFPVPAEFQINKSY